MSPPWNAVRGQGLTPRVEEVHLPRAVGGHDLAALAEVEPRDGTAVPRPLVPRPVPCSELPDPPAPLK